MDKLWMRVGDQGDYESFDNPYDAGYDISPYFEALRVKRLPKVSRYGVYGVEVGDSFVGPYNYVSLFWGDNDAQPTRDISSADISHFRAGLSEGLDLPARPRSKSVTKKSKSKSRKQGDNLSSVRGVRR